MEEKCVIIVLVARGKKDETFKMPIVWNVPSVILSDIGPTRVNSFQLSVYINSKIGQRTSWYIYKIITIKKKCKLPSLKSSYFSVFNCIPEYILCIKTLSPKTCKAINYSPFRLFFFFFERTEPISKNETNCSQLMGLILEGAVHILSLIRTAWFAYKQPKAPITEKSVLCLHPSTIKNNTLSKKKKKSLKQSEVISTSLHIVLFGSKEGRRYIVLN